MANLHNALKALAPTKFSDVPQKQEELDPYLADLFSEVQTVVESIPIPDPDPAHRHRSHTTGSIAPNNASEMFVSSARSPQPPPEYAKLQSEWGKPYKLSAKENPLGISVYKLSGKDGKGAWFARRSVHEGLGFSRFKHGFEREFPTSLAVQGKPGEGNIRGIGAETRIEEITVPNRGKVEVYRLSAQFPGPTTPRDFVTMLVTSSKAMKHHGEPDLTPRHYMIVSKPCDHPETQPRSGFIRGQYESVEFIREIPRKLKATTSSTDLSHHIGHHKAATPSLEKDVLKRNADQHAHESEQHLSVDTSGSAQREISPSGRKRSVTVDAPASPIRHPDPAEPFDPEENPVEWIMVTRSDPGGSVPRFMVERGTPASICADAVKFLDWACQREDDDEEHHHKKESRPSAHRRESFASWEANGTLAGIKEHEEGALPAIDPSPPHTPKAAATHLPSLDGHDASQSAPNSPASPTFMNNFTETIGAYTPQVLRDHLPHFGEAHASQGQQDFANKDVRTGENQGGDEDDDGSSTISSVSFASADSHLNSEPTSPSISSKSLTDQSESQLLQKHDKEMAKLVQRKEAMDAKFAKQREKLASQTNKDSDKEQQALRKAEEKHQKELKKQEEKYQKEVAKLEQKKKREAQKLKEKKRKDADKDEKSRLTRERDEARAELEHLKMEQDLLTRQVGELQKENTTLMARIGKLEGSGLSVDSPPSVTSRFRATTLGQESRGRSLSLTGRKKEKAETSSQHS
ncbi:hypothetical protein H2200_007190 [Cladophialophora chaetospira]|uniref:DUF3074 domain-containing protein n=1 Tax=Cladophialophora chaetospira TaxID=386627 RepID=A0AA39CHA7_9EURO|nr:hypothetical protein H2200_007190 [Cladophialophora chaetospira]